LLERDGREYSTASNLTFFFAHRNFVISQRDQYQRYGISQQLTGLTPNKPYTLQFTYEMTGVGGIYDGGVNIHTQLDGVQVNSLNLQGRDDLYIVTVHTVTITPTSSNPVLYISCGGYGNYYYGATMAMDDVSLGMACSTNPSGPGR
jgi:hypothetical protein